MEIKRLNTFTLRFVNKLRYLLLVSLSPPTHFLVTQHAALVGKPSLTFAALKCPHIVVHVHMTFIVAFHLKTLVAIMTPIFGVVLVEFAHMASQTVGRFEKGVTRRTAMQVLHCLAAVLRLKLSYQLVGVLDAGCCTQDERPVTLRVVL
jgi:hypothetical protein